VILEEVSDMKVGNDKSLVNLEAYIKNTQNSGWLKASPKQGQKKAVQKERVKLSTAAREIQKAREVLEAIPEIREDKVRQFKREIGLGIYEVKGNLVAEKMLNESLIDAFV